MRELKFRQWLKERGMHYFAFEDGICSGVVSPALKRYPLMQYTGLKDKTGKEIYEGDIVKVYSRTDHTLGIIEFHKCQFVFKIKEEKHYSPYRYLHGWRSIEIIGDIYENPELFEVNHEKD